MEEEKMLELYIPIGQKDRVIKEAHQEIGSRLIRFGWTHNGVVELTDARGDVTEFAVIKSSLDS